MKATSLHISIPNPCGEDFTQMKAAGAGRHCGKCDKVIYDFSQMTDSELLNFFKNNPVHCGRFHQSQLNRGVAPVHIRNKFFQRFVKFAASVIAILTLRSMPAVAQGVVIPPAEQTLKNTATPPVMPAGPIFIKGTVKDDENNPLKNAVVNFDELRSTSTDENGAYSFELNGINEPHNIYFSCVNYVTTVRTYHPAMGNTDFNVVMGRRDTNAVVYSMGIIMPPPQFQTLEDLPSLTFKKGKYALTVEMKTLLSETAAKMKANRFSNIRLIAYCPVCSKNPLWLKRTDQIKSYLIETGGIAADRILTEGVTSEENYNIIDIKAVE